ncbi:MAG: hypothetical protein HY233_06495 [Acidobacteriales bacterium]|nr:hypothetical protein [Candidatus Koribacter versatilis]MBI3645595.1 hypothetical protein [Terriglobales bacterium]
MKTGRPNRIGLVLLGILLLAPLTFAQLQVGDNTTLKLNGMAGLGWTGTYDGNSLNSLTYGFSGNLTGDYYDERFLNWSINPYLNQSRLNSNFNSTSSATGVSALANFLSSSRTPMQFTYQRDHNAEGTFNVPGSTGSYRTVGDDQSVGVTASYLPEDWPSIQGNFSHSGSSYEVIGNPGGGSAHAAAFGLSSAYEVFDTRLSGSYTKSYGSSESPLLGQQGGTLKTDNSQDSLQFGANRRLSSWSSGSFNFGRSHLNADYVGARTNATFNTISGLLSAQATKRLSFNFHANYSSNLSAQFLSEVFNGSKAANGETKGLSFTSSYLNYGVTSGYNIARDLTATGSINHQVQGQPGFPDVSSTIMNAGLTWSHQVLGGSLGAHYGIAHYFSPLQVRTNNQTVTKDSTFTGQNAAVSYGRTFFGFATSGSFSYGRSLTTLLVGYVQNNYSANGSVSRNVRNWNVAVSGSYSNAHIEHITVTDSSNQSYAASLSHKSLGLSANYSRGNGSGLQVGSNIIPNPGPGPLPLVLFSGESYGGGLSYRPVRRWTVSSTFTKLKYNTLNLGQNSNNTSEQFFLRSDYHFRQMYFNFGYSHLTQGFGVGPARPATIDTVFFGVSRRFDIF